MRGGTPEPWTRGDWIRLIVCLLPGLVPVFLIARHAVNVPYWDNWNMLLLREVEGRGLAAHWALVNEHRFFLPRVVDIVLARMSNFDILLWVWVKVPAVAAIVAMEYLLVRRHGSRIEAWLMTPWLGLFNFSLVYWPMWIDPRPLGSHFALFGLLFGLWATTALPVGWVALATAMAGAAFSSLSFASGNATWFILAGVLWFSGYRRFRYFVAWGLGASAVLVPYVVDVLRCGVLDRTGHGAEAMEIVRYVVVFLGSPLTFRLGPAGVGPAFAWGLFGVLAAVGITFAAVRWVDDGLREALPWLAMMMWVGLAAVAAGAGRAGLGLHQALAPRYVNTTAAFWVALLALAILVLPQGGEGLRARRTRCAARSAAWTVTIVVGASLIGVNVVQVDRLPPALERKLERGLRCLEAYPDCDEECLRLLYPDAVLVRRIMDRLIPMHPSFLPQVETETGRSDRCRSHEEPVDSSIIR